MSAARPLALIVEDRPEVSAMWIAALEELQMDIRVATSLVDAKKLSVKIPPPDLILLDLRLEDADSKQTIDSIESLKQGNPDVVVLIVSGLLTPDVIKLAIEKGAHDAIEKLDIQHRKDLWHAILKARDKANAEGKNALQATSELIKQLTSILHVL